MRFFALLLRLWSYVFHLALCGFLLGLALLSLFFHQTLRLTGLLPFTDDKMIEGILILALIGLLSTLLAITGFFKYLFPLWTALVLVLMIKGFIFSTYSFSDGNAFKGASWLTFGALGAFFGGLWVLKPRRGRL